MINNPQNTFIPLALTLSNSIVLNLSKLALYTIASNVLPPTDLSVLMLTMLLIATTESVLNIGAKPYVQSAKKLGLRDWNRAWLLNFFVSTVSGLTIAFSLPLVSDYLLNEDISIEALFVAALIPISISFRSPKLWMLERYQKFKIPVILETVEHLSVPMLALLLVNILNPLEAFLSARLVSAALVSIASYVLLGTINRLNVSDPATKERQNRFFRGILVTSLLNLPQVHGLQWLAAGVLSTEQYGEYMVLLAYWLAPIHAISKAIGRLQLSIAKHSISRHESQITRNSPPEFVNLLHLSFFLCIIGSLTCGLLAAIFLVSQAMTVLVALATMVAIPRVLMSATSGVFWGLGNTTQTSRQGLLNTSVGSLWILTAYLFFAEANSYLVLGMGSVAFCMPGSILFWRSIVSKFGATMLIYPLTQFAIVLLIMSPCMFFVVKFESVTEGLLESLLICISAACVVFNYQMASYLKGMIKNFLRR